MAMFDFFKSKAKPGEPRELTAEEKEWLEAFRSVLTELVPGEKFELRAYPEPANATRFELITESKRAMVAWAEIQELLAGKELIQPPPGKP